MMATTMEFTAQPTRPIGDLLREWRERRRLSQMALALDAEVSTRHLSFLETGRAQPSREMILRLAEHLEVPLRDRNSLLLAAGFAPAFPRRPLDDPALAAARDVLDRVLTGHEPFPALAIDRHWSLLAANRAVSPLLEGVAASLLQPPVNVLRLSLHPDGLAPRIVNLAEWRRHLLARLDHEVELSADPGLEALLVELRDCPAPVPGPAVRTERREAERVGIAGVAVPFQLETGLGTLSFISTTMVFGTATDVTLAELAIEAFFPADAATASILAGRMPDATSESGESGEQDAGPPA